VSGRIGRPHPFPHRSPVSGGRWSDGVTAIRPPSHGVVDPAERYVQPGSALLGVGRWSCPCAARDPFPGCRSPDRVSDRVHAPVESIPSRVPRFLPAVRPLAGADFPEVPRPFDDITRASPTCGGPSSVRRGSAPRRSQPLSGFLAGTSSGPSRAPAVHGIFPFRAFPSRRSRAPLEARLLPCSQSPTLVERDARALSPPVSPTPGPLHLSRGLAPRSPGSPVGYGLPFHAARARPFGRSPPRFPVAPGPRTGIARSRPAPPASKPSSLRRVRSRAGGSPHPARSLLSWGCAPPEPCSDQTPDPT
jgi:hypothetical protein